MKVHCHGNSIKIPSDKYLNDPEHVEELEGYGMDVEASDFNCHFVPVDKFDKDNLKKTEDSISDDFSL